MKTSLPLLPVLPVLLLAFCPLIALADPSANTPPSEHPGPNSPGFARTRIIGFSQVGQPRGGWFVADGVFESIAGNDRWELLWNGGAGVDKWQDLAYEGWSRPLVSPCPGDTPVDRVLLSISGPYGADEKAWAQAITATIRTITAKLPSARQIILQAVVGGPGGQPCPAPAGGPARGDGRVRASWQHAHIVRAINEVVKELVDGPVAIVAGFEPQVRSCEDYADALGHITPAGGAAAGRAIGEYYARLDGSSTGALQVPKALSSP
jgi:hypothetical protein